MSTSESKTAMFKEIEGRSSEIIQLARDLIRIPSENPLGNVDKITDFLKNYLQDNGIDVSMVEGVKGKPNLLCETGSKDSSKILLLNGHLDVVPAGAREEWKFDPFGGEIRNGFIYGRGASDMKAGVAGIIFAFIMLHHRRESLRGRVKLQLVPDEETGGLHGTKWLVDNGYADSTAAIFAEPTALGKIDVGQKGILWLRIETHGTPAHGSLSPYVGDNAIIKAMTLANELQSVTKVRAKPPADILRVINSSKRVAEQLIGRKGVGRILQSPTVNLGLISGGSKVNMVPDRCTLEMDIRLPIGIEARKVLDAVKRLTSRHDSALKVLNESAANYTSPREDIVRILENNVHGVMGKRPVIFVQWATSDARFLREKGVPTVHYGPAHLQGIHGFNEKVRAADIVAATKAYVATALDYLA